MDPEGFFRELSRRRVFRVAASYAVVAWLVIQVAEVSFEAFELPSWSLRLVILLALLGFPIAVALAWAFDLTSRGLERTPRAARGQDAAEDGGGPPARPRALFATLVVIAAVAAGALTIARVSGDGGDVDGDPRESVIVFPFENRTSSGEWGYLEHASMNLLGLALSHWDEMRVYDDERTSSLLRREGLEAADVGPDVARDLAREAGTGTFVLGEIRREGDSLAIEAKVYDRESGEQVAREIARFAQAGDPRAPFNRLAGAILQISGAPPGERPDLLAQTTRSLEAYRAYLAGTRSLQQFQVDSAAASFERAIEIDSTFALAYLRRRDVDGWSGIESNPARQREWIAKAVAYSEGLPPRYAALVRFHEAYAAGRHERAREIARGMIERDSTDAEAWYQLGEAHFHGSPTAFPHADSLGDFVSALTAFRRTLALDSSYVLAYQHILDVLGSCAGDGPWLCLEDRTVYASRDELEAEFGANELAERREEAAEARLETAWAWASAAPASARARGELLGLLLDAGRTDEVAGQLDVLRARGQTVLADTWEIRVDLAERDYGTAAVILERLLRDPEVRLSEVVDTPEWALAALLAGGRAGLAIETMERLLAIVPADSVSGPGGFRWSKPLLSRSWQATVRSLVGQEVELLASATHAWLDAIDGSFEPGGREHRSRWLESGLSVLGAYLATGDTTLLARFTASSDSAPSRTWRTMEAFLALERGDTASARARLESRFENRDAVELSGDPGAMRLFAWATLLERVGEPARAAEAFALFDTEASPYMATVLHVRSWYERGRLWSALGEAERAAESYERFVNAWSEGDPAVQPIVERARSALEEVRAAS